MVTPDGRGERAQLILVGCIALAFVIISLGLMINTTIYTESSSQALSNAQVDSATSLDLETRRGTRSLVHRVNLGPRDRTPGGLHGDVGATVDNYSVLLGEQYATSRAATITVDYSETDSDVGTRVVQAGDGNFDDGFTLDGRHRISWFAINANVSRTDEGDLNPFTLSVDNGTGPNLEISMYKNTSTPTAEPNMTIETRLGDEKLNTTCDPRRNRVVLDAVSGETIADDCTEDMELYSIDDLAVPHTAIDVEHSGSFDGSWEFITNASYASDPVTAGSNFECAGGNPASSDACSTPAIWTANVTTAFDSDGASFHRNRMVTIYGSDDR